MNYLCFIMFFCFQFLSTEYFANQNNADMLASLSHEQLRLYRSIINQRLAQHEARQAAQEVAQPIGFLDRTINAVYSTMNFLTSEQTGPAQPLSLEGDLLISKHSFLKGCSFFLGSLLTYYFVTRPNYYGIRAIRSDSGKSTLIMLPIGSNKFANNTGFF